METARNTQREDAFQALLEEISQNRMQREDPYEIAAFLESIGWNDDRAAQVFGAADIFELAENCWDALQYRVIAGNYAPTEQRSFWRTAVIIIRNFFRGLIFALPMLISVLAMLVIRFSLWSYEALPVDLATGIAIGTILSFMTVGGFTQAIARRGFYYLTLGYYNMGRQITFRFVYAGWIVCALIAGLMIVANLFFNVFSVLMITVIVLYYIFLSTIWLSTTVMYLLKRDLIFTLLLAFGIFLVFVMFRILQMDIILSQIIALGFVTIVAGLWVYIIFKKEENKMEQGIHPSLTRMSVMAYGIAPYFFYGFLYFTFLFLDRIIAWSTNSGVYMPYFIWFRGQYELGLDFALIMLMIPMGFIETFLNDLMLKVEAAPKNYMGNETASMNAYFKDQHRRNLLIVLLISLACAVVAYFVVMYIDGHEIFHPRMINNPTTHFVFIVALLSYALLSVGLMNSIVMFSLSRPWEVVQSVYPALFVNFAVGFFLTRFGDWWMENVARLGIEPYSLAIFGLLAGTLVFMVLSSIKALQIIHKLDYYLYSAT